MMQYSDKNKNFFEKKRKENLDSNLHKRLIRLLYLKIVLILLSKSGKLFN